MSRTMHKAAGAAVVLRSPKSAPAATKRAPVAKARPMTIRLEPRLQHGLKLLNKLLRRPVNKLVTEAVEGFIEQRTAAVEHDLRDLLAQIEAYKTHDPSFELAFARWADGEASHGAQDPVEGEIVTTFSSTKKKSKQGPSQTKVRDLLGG